MELSKQHGKLDALSRMKINQQKYEIEKKERQERFVRLQQERQRILEQREQILNRLEEDKDVRFPPSRQSNMSINAALSRARDKIPLYERTIQENVDSNEARRRILQQPYRGELGIGSYEPWQLEDFYFVRDFVQSWLDEIVDYIIMQPCSDYDGNSTGTTFKELQDQLDQEQSKLEFTKCVKEVQMDILGEVSDELITETVDESLSIHYQSRHVIANMILNAVIGDKTDDNTTTLISNTYNQMKKERHKHPGLWHHGQKFEYLGDETMETTSGEKDTFDGKVLSFEGITPIESITDQALSQDFKSYRFLESKFWSGNSPTLSSLPLPRRYKGVACMALSSDHSLLAVGTVQGDMAIWNLLEYPPRILKGCKGNSSITNIQWSVDSTQIVTINQRGTIQFWSLVKGGNNTIDIKAFEPVENDGFQPTQLVSEMSLEPKDLVFTQGNLTSATSVVSKPSYVVFHPSLSFLGRQESVVVGLSTGNVIKLNFDENTIPSTHRVPITDTVNKVGKGIDAELFKAHNDPIKLIGFIDNTSQMVTVDSQGFIYLWEYTDNNLSGYGWYTPLSSYRLDMTQRTFKPADGSNEKTEFDDVVKGTGRVKELNRQDMIVKRKQMQTFINSLHLGKPWKTTNSGNQKVNYLYAPRSVPESGATFHSVTYNKDTKVLAHYSTQLYRPITITTTKMMSCKMNALGNKIVFSLLFDEVLPKVPHTVFVTIELPAIKIASNLIEVPLSDEEYKQCEIDDCCDFDISRRIDATGVEYMFTNICGVVNGFSLSTTNLIMASSERGWVGCSLSDDQSNVFTTARVKIASQIAGLCIVFYSPKQNIVNLLHVRDDNTKSTRLQVWQAFCKLQDTREGIHPRESLRKHPWILDGNTACHLECTIESLVLDLVDKAIQQSTGEETDSSCILDNRIWPFVRSHRQGVSSDDSTPNSGSSIG